MTNSNGKKKIRIDELVIVTSRALFGEGTSRYYVNGKLRAEANGNHAYREGFVDAFRLLWDNELTLTTVSIEDENREDCSSLMLRHKTRKFDRLMQKIVKHPNFYIETVVD